MTPTTKAFAINNNAKGIAGLFAIPVAQGCATKIHGFKLLILQAKWKLHFRFVGAEQIRDDLFSTSQEITSLFAGADKPTPVTSFI